MATTLALTLLLLAGRQTPTTDTTTFTDPALGLSFAHPTAWTPVASATVAETPRGKGNRLKIPFGKKKNDKETRPPEGMVAFTIPGSTGSESAQLTIVRASFSDAPEKWQQLQADANRNLKRDVERQWQQEILGVPLLLTRIAYVQDGTPKTTVTGLLYNAAPYKLLFRLTGPTAGFDAAQFQFTQAMESLRTTSDTLPTPQEPGKPIAPPPAAPGPDAKHHLMVKPKTVLKVAPLSLPVAVGGRKMLLRVPEGWTLEKVAGDTATLRNPSLKNPVAISLYSGSTAQRAADAFAAASNKRLDEFKTVELREDPPGKPNEAGNPVFATWRRGTNDKGACAALDALAIVGDYYMLFEFHPSTGEELTHERHTVQAMLDAVGLEPAP